MAASSASACTSACSALNSATSSERCSASSRESATANAHEATTSATIRPRTPVYAARESGKRSERSPKNEMTSAITVRAMPKT